MMIRRVAIGFLLLFSIFGFSQVPKIIKIKVQSYPNQFQKYEELASQIASDFDTPADRAAAAYVWIASNIDYDVSRLNVKAPSIKFSYRNEAEKTQKLNAIEYNRAKKTYDTRQAVCEGYTALYKRICDYMGVECVIINGVAKSSKELIGDRLLNPNHSWNAVKIDNEWKLVDVTWGAGTLQSRSFKKKYTDIFFFTPPEKFFLNHYPKDKKWLLIDKTEKEFVSFPLFHSKYLKSNIELIAPIKGVIRAAKNSRIQVEIKTEESIQKFAYSFNKGKIITQKIKNKKEGDVLILEIPVKGKFHGYLTIFYDRTSWVTYKVVLM